MNTIIGNGLNTYRHTQQASRQNHTRIGNGNWGGAAEPLYEDARSMNIKDSGISAQEAYERMSGSGKALPEAEQDEECKNKSVEEGSTEQLSPTEDEIEILKVTDIEVVSLHNGVSFYYNCDTGELQCINHNDGRPGRHALWSKTLSYEDWERCCDEMLDRYADRAAGQFVYRYQAYLRHEEFWDMYLDGKVDLRTLTEKDVALSEEELYDKFLLDMASHKE